MANRNFSNGGKTFMMETKPVKITCNFVVDSTNGNGLGIRSLKGALVQNVFMHTTQTPGAGNSNPATPNVTVTNPNPAAGYIVIQLQDNYSRILSGSNAIVSPVSGSSLLVASAGLTVGLPYIITTLGTTTRAQWTALGVPAGVVPALGVAFVAAATSATGTGAVMVPATAGSGIFSIETVGDGNQSIAPDPTKSQGFGAQFIVRCLKDSAGDAPVIGTPADNTVISLDFLLSDSSVTSGQGE
jgi:hypothetical protein